MSCCSNVLSSESRDIMNGASVNDLPLPVLMDIFFSLPISDLHQCSLVCSYWWDILRDEVFWEHKFCQDWLKSQRGQIRRPKSMSWFSEYHRLHEVKHFSSWTSLSVHNDEILHVSFSHCGSYLCTSSKDKTAIIWEISEYSKRSIVIKYKMDFQEWEFVQCTSFNDTDDLLLVSGVLELFEFRAQGEIRIYTFPGCGLVKTVVNRPFDCFGTWFDNSTFLSGDFDAIQLCSVVMLHSAFDAFPSKILVSNPVVRLNQPYPFKTLLVSDILNQSNKKMLFFATSFAALHAHAIAAIKINGIQSEAQYHELDGLPTTAVEPNNGDTSYFNSTESSYSCELSSKKSVDLKAAVIGLETTTQHVYVNCRPWVSQENTDLITNDIEFRILDFDLNLLKVISEGKAVTPSDKFFLIHLSSSKLYVVSGDEEGYIHIYDKHYNVHVCKFHGHNNVVNCAAISPTNPRFMCTVSDDCLIKFWDF